MPTIAQNLDFITSNIATLCRKYQRKQSDVSLIAVSKTILSDKIEEAIIWGIKNFGENRVEEAWDKWPELKIKYPDVKLHLIGHLQSKKAKKAVQLFDYIHSLDSLKLAKILKDEMEKQQKFPKIFLQVNIGSEEEKSGASLEELDELIINLKKMDFPIFGLMCIPPVQKEASLYFALLNKIAKKYQISNLSMGMSGDFESAIATGSNYLRIGTAIFGADSRR